MPSISQELVFFMLEVKPMIIDRDHQISKYRDIILSHTHKGMPWHILCVKSCSEGKRAWVCVFYYTRTGAQSSAISSRPTCLAMTQCKGYQMVVSVSYVHTSFD